MLVHLFFVLSGFGSKFKPIQIYFWNRLWNKKNSKEKSFSIKPCTTRPGSRFPHANFGLFRATPNTFWSLVRCHDCARLQAAGHPDEVDVFIHWLPLSGWLNKLISLFTYWTRAPACYSFSMQFRSSCRPCMFTAYFQPSHLNIRKFSLHIPSVCNTPV